MEKIELKENYKENVANYERKNKDLLINIEEMQNENNNLKKEKIELEESFSFELEELKIKVQTETKRILSNDYETLRKNLNEEKKIIVKKIKEISRKL